MQKTTDNFNVSSGHDFWKSFKENEPTKTGKLTTNLEAEWK